MIGRLTLRAVQQVFCRADAAIYYRVPCHCRLFSIRQGLSEPFTHGSPLCIPGVQGV